MPDTEVTSVVCKTIYTARKDGRTAVHVVTAPERMLTSLDMLSEMTVVIELPDGIRYRITGYDPSTFDLSDVGSLVIGATRIEDAE